MAAAAGNAPVLPAVTENAAVADPSKKAAVMPAGGAGSGMSVPPVPSEPTKILGAGSYGFVVKPALPNYYNGAWHQYPNNVTKLFYNEDSRKKIIDLAPKITGIIGPNEGHRINAYQHAYKIKNTPATVQARLSGAPNKNLFPVRMPYLGVDLTAKNLENFYPEIRKRPVGVILAQTLKLLQQVKNIKDQKYIHGDIRSTNVMIRPDTGAMTLIDFDFLSPEKEFVKEYPFGFYCHPPETLQFFDEKIKDPTQKSKIYANKVYTYIIDVLNQFGSLLPRVVGVSNEYKEIGRYILATKNKNITRVASGEITPSQLLYTFDSYGIGWTLLLLYAYVYPGSVEKEITAPAMTAFAGSLTARLPGGTNIDAAVTAILNMTSSVLIPLAQMDSDDRLEIDEAVEMARGIVASYEAEIAEGLAVVGGGAGASSRKCRRSRRKITKRRASTRRFGRK